MLTDICIPIKCRSINPLIPWEIDIVQYEIRDLGDLWIGTGNESEDLYWPSKRRGQGLILISLGFMSGIVMIYKEFICYNVHTSIFFNSTSKAGHLN